MSKENAFGTTLKIGTVAVGSLTNIEGVKISKDTIEVTTHDSTDGYREFLPGLKDGGEVSAEGYLDASNTGQTAMLTALESDGVSAFTITFPGGASWAFDGIVTAFETSAPLDGAVPYSSTIKVSGKPTLTTA